jgi:hypothetical protein
LNLEVTIVVQCTNSASISSLAIDGSVLQQHQFYDARSRIQNNLVSKDT